MPDGLETTGTPLDRSSIPVFATARTQTKEHNMKDDITLSEEAVNGYTKKDRAADTIEPLVIAYVAMVGGYEEDKETTLTDLLSDLHHWADVNGLDWDDASRRAEMHYDAETDEEDDEEDDGQNITTWADGFGTWHAAIVVDKIAHAVGAQHAARAAIAYEIRARGNGADTEAFLSSDRYRIEKVGEGEETEYGIRYEFREVELAAVLVG